MMKIFKKIQSKLSTYEAIFPPLIKRTPIMTVDNNKRIYIENGCQIMNFTSSKIQLRTSIGDIDIYGTHLLINSMYHHELVIDGNIEQLIYNRIERT